MERVSSAHGLPQTHGRAWCKLVANTYRGRSLFCVFEFVHLSACKKVFAVFWSPYNLSVTATLCIQHYYQLIQSHQIFGLTSEKYDMKNWEMSFAISLSSVFYLTIIVRRGLWLWWDSGHGLRNLLGDVGDPMSDAQPEKLATGRDYACRCFLHLHAVLCHKPAYVCSDAVNLEADLIRLEGWEWLQLH